MAFENFYATRLFTDIGANDDAITLEKAPSVASGRLVLEPRNPSQREIISFTGVNGTQITGVSRGQGGTTAKPHSKGALVEMNVTAEDMNDIYDLFDTGNVMINTAKLARFEGGAGVPDSVGVLGNEIYYTTVGTSTWTKPEGLRFVIVEVQGGGGGGGGAVNANAASGGGGGGGYARKKIMAADLGVTETVTVGSGGAGLAGTGGHGSSSLFGGHCTGGGGRGSTYSSSGGGNGADGGAVVGGDFMMPGGNGQGGVSGAIGGVGGFSFFSAGGVAQQSLRTPIAPGYGGGGSGVRANSDTARTGGSGGQGIVIVKEFF